MTTHTITAGDTAQVLADTLELNGSTLAGATVTLRIKDVAAGTYQTATCTVLNAAACTVSTPLPALIAGEYWLQYYVDWGSPTGAVSVPSGDTIRLVAKEALVAS